MASIRIGSLLGIPIKLGVSFLLVLPILAYLIGSQVGLTVGLLNDVFGAGIDPDPLTAGALPWALGAVAAVGLFASVLAHELGHSMVARRYGLTIESITLWFLGGLAQFARMPDDWRQEFWIAVAGPIVSVALGVGFYGTFLAVPEYPAARVVLGYLAILNVVLAGFNMLPGFPMDGGRVLRALLSRNRSRVQATETAAAVGKGFAFLIGIAGVFVFDPFLILIAFFIFIAASSETRQVVLEAAFEGMTVDEIMTPAERLHTVSPETPVDDLLDRMVSERHTGYPVVTGDELVGIVTLEDVQELPADRRAELTVREIMSTDLVTLPADAEATRALSTIQEADIGRILVTDADGSLAGLLSRTDLMTVLEIARTSDSQSVAARTVGR